MAKYVFTLIGIGALGVGCFVASSIITNALITKAAGEAEVEDAP